MLKQTLLLAALLATTAAPALAADPVPGAQPQAVAPVEGDVNSNRLATAKLWAEAKDDVASTRQALQVGDWAQSLVRVRRLRAHVEGLQTAKVVEPQARLLMAELRPSVIDLEARIIRRNGSASRYADILAKRMERTQNELIAQGMMERLMGGGAGTGVPKQPEVLIIPPGGAIPANAVPVTPVEKPETQAPGNERNQLDERRFPQE